jgi:hypothetical protein
LITAVKGSEVNFNSTIFQYSKNGIITATTVSPIGATVELGGLTWMPVYLTETNSGQVVLDLWLADNLDSKGYQWNEFADGISSNTYSTSMYGTSKIRSYLTGSWYATSNGEYDVKGNQNETITSFLNLYGSYLATPSQIEYQATESAVAQGISANYNCPNDAYGTPSAGSWASANVNYTDKGTNYTCWSNDKIWLPSITETGSSSASGIWKLSTAQLSSSNMTNTWLRSGDSNNYYYVNSLDSTGSISANSVTLSY